MPDPGYLQHLYSIVISRKGVSPDDSYIAQLFHKGRRKIAQKVGEEATEVAIAATSQGKKELIDESADLIFHLLVLWADAGIVPEEVLEEMQRREGISGLSEKAGRKG